MIDSCELLWEGLHGFHQAALEENQMPLSSGPTEENAIMQEIRAFKSIFIDRELGM